MTAFEQQIKGIAELLRNYVDEEILGDGTRVELDENLLSDGLVDSLGMMRMVGYLEAQYSIKVPPDQFTIENFRNIDVISRYASSLIAAATK